MLALVLPILLSFYLWVTCCSRKRVTTKEHKSRTSKSRTRSRSSATSGSRTKTPGGRSRTPIDDPGSAPMISALQSTNSPSLNSPSAGIKARRRKNEEDQDPSRMNDKLKSTFREGKDTGPMEDTEGKKKEKKGNELKEAKNEEKGRPTSKDKKSHMSSATIPYVPQQAAEYPRGLNQKPQMAKSMTYIQDDTTLRNTSLIQTVTVEEEPPKDGKPTATTPVGKKAGTPAKEASDEKAKPRQNRQPPTVPVDPTEDSSAGPTTVLLKKTQASDDEGRKKSDERVKKTGGEGRKKKTAQLFRNKSTESGMRK